MIDFKKPRKFILDTLFPIECLGCQKQDVWLCDHCFEKLSLDKSNQYENCQNTLSSHYLDGFFIASDWENKVLQEVVHKFKYNFVRELAEPLSRLIIEKLDRLIHYNNILGKLILTDFVLVPIPLHKRRLTWRGFNQAELIAQKVAEKINLKLEKKLLIRIKNTLPQVKLKSQQRIKNIQGAFDINKNRRDAPDGCLCNNNFLLIDDVITTGVTMNEAAKVLKNNGAEKVIGLAVAKG